MGNLQTISVFAELILLTVISLKIKPLESREFQVTRSFYIRHYYGKCLRYDVTRQAFSFHAICKEKFEWHGGARFIHIPTGKCVNVNATNDGSFLSLTDQCDVKSTIFQYDEKERMIKHLMSGKCLHPEGSDVDPPNKDKVIIKSGCNHDTNRYYFRKMAYYVIRHFGGLCWTYSSSDNLMKFYDPIACERFVFSQDNRVIHVKTGKCAVVSNGFLRLTEDCKSSQAIFWHNELSQIQNDANQCLQPRNGLQNPSHGSLIELSGCKNENYFKFNIFDDKDIVRVKIISESCLEITPGLSCSIAKGHLVINGRQTSLNSRGINLVLLDYRSGLFEHRATFDVLGYDSARNELAAYLNGVAPGKILLMTAKDAVVFNSDLVIALQKVGVSATFTMPPQTQVSMALVGYTGPERKFWEKSVNKVGGSGASVIEVSINTFVDQDGIADCSDELGIRAGKIPNSRFYAETTWANDVHHRPYEARLHLHKPGWCSAVHVPVPSYLQVDLGTSKLISGVAIQGHGTAVGYRVRQFKIQYSNDGASWQFYKGNGVVETVFDGLRASVIEVTETKVNWFQNTLARLIRIVPTARILHVTCIRLELFGCISQNTFIIADESQSETRSINEVYKESMFVFGVSKGNLSYGTSSAADEQNLATNIDQTHIESLNASLTFDNGTLLQETGKITKVKDLVSGVEKAAFIEFETEREDYHAFAIESNKRVVDAKLPNGTRWSVFTIEQDSSLAILALPRQIQRNTQDKSILEFNITSNITGELVDGNHFHLNLSLSHILGTTPESHSNAYEARIVVYFDKNFLEFKHLKFVYENGLSLPPSSNQTKEGLVDIKTKIFSLLRNQKIQLEFMFGNEHKILNAKCQGEIIVDFVYMNNLKFFNGTFNTSIGKLLPYKCKAVQSSNGITVKAPRLSTPMFSILHDNASQDFFFCYQKKSHMKRNSPFCYMQTKQNTDWINIPHLSVIVGIDTSRRTLYGIDNLGTTYIRSAYPFTEFTQIEDTGWTAIQNNKEVRKSLTGSHPSLLPSVVDASWVFSVSEVPIWAATATGISKRVDGTWKRVISW